MIRRNRIHLRKRYSHPKNNTNSTEPSNYLDDGDVKNNELNNDSDDEVGNNFNRAVTEMNLNDLTVNIGDLVVLMIM